MKRRNQRTYIKQIIVFSILLVSIGYGGYLLFFSTSIKTLNPDVMKRKGYFHETTYLLDNQMVLKVEYFDKVVKAAETKMKWGMKHQQMESWYPDGSQFRTANYWYDTLIAEVYF